MKKILMPSVSRKLAQLRDVAMWELQKELGHPVKAIEAWQRFIENLPKGVELEELSQELQEKIAHWESKMLED